MAWFRNWSTTTKLMAGFALVCMVMVTVGYLGITRMGDTNNALRTLYDRDLVGLSDAADANIAVVKIGRSVRQCIIEREPAAIETQRQKVEASFKVMTEHLDLVEKRLATERGKELVASIRQILPDYLPAVRRILDLAAANQDEAARLELIKAGQMGERLDVFMNEIAELKLKVGEQAYAASQTAYDSATRQLVGLIAFGTVLGLVIGFVVARLIAGPLGRAVAVLQAVGAGDYTHHLDIVSKDEVGRMAQALNETVDSVRNALAEVRDVAGTVSSASQQLSAGAQAIASGAQEQASSLEETAASLEEITSAVKQNGDSAQQASQLAVSSRDTAQHGGEVVGRAVEAMTEINQSSKRIADIITTIDEIAFQTNLLALNAAVEAARAGEQGRGFAVVAAEVRNLAQRSASSAKEIKGLIQDSVRKVESGSDLVNRSGDTLLEIVTSVKRVTDIVGEIAAASREQNTGIDQVNRAVMQMDQVTQANASQTEELSGTAESLAAQAEQLQALVSRFKLGDDGGSVRPRMAPTNARVLTLKSAPPPATAGRPSKLRAARPAVKTGTTDEAVGQFEEY